MQRGYQDYRRGPPHSNSQDFRPPFHNHVEFQGQPQNAYDPHFYPAQRMPDPQWGSRAPQPPVPHHSAMPGPWDQNSYDPNQPMTVPARGGNDRDRFQQQRNDSARDRGNYQRRNGDSQPQHVQAPISIAIAPVSHAPPLRLGPSQDWQDRNERIDGNRNKGSRSSQQGNPGLKAASSSDRKGRQRQDDQLASSSNKRQRLEKEEESDRNASNTASSRPAANKASYTRKEDDSESRGRAARSPSVDSLGRARKRRSPSSASSTSNESHYRRSKAHKARSRSPPAPSAPHKNAPNKGKGRPSENKGRTGPNEAAVRELKSTTTINKTQRHVRRGRSPRSRSRTPPPARRPSPSRSSRHNYRDKSRSRSRSRDRKSSRRNQSPRRNSSPPRRRSPSPQSRPASHSPPPARSRNGQPLPPQSSTFAAEASTPRGPRDWRDQDGPVAVPKTGAALPIRPIVPSRILAGFKRVAPTAEETARAEVQKFFPDDQQPAASSNTASDDIAQIIAAAERAAMMREQQSRGAPASPVFVPSGPSRPSHLPPMPAGHHPPSIAQQQYLPPPSLPHNPNSMFPGRHFIPAQSHDSPFAPGDTSLKNQYSQDDVPNAPKFETLDPAETPLPETQPLETPIATPRNEISEPVTQSSRKSSRAKAGELYERLNQVGEGTYGKVYKARNVESGTMVALKRIRMEAEKDGFPITSVREIKLLQSMRHENVIQLLEMMVSQGSVYMVFEYMDHDLTGVLRHPDISFTPAHLKSLMLQLLQGLAYIHKRRILHRDLKGSNILLSKRGELKIADFGLARFYVADKKNDYTNRVITQWYKPPELLYGGTVYEAEVDMWSAGCIFLELFTKRPTFQGQDEIHQLEVIFKYLGTPSEENWPSVFDLPWYELVKPKESIACRFKETFGTKYLKTPATIDLAQALLALDPSKRPTAAQALQMPYFTTELPQPEQPTMLEDVRGDWHEMETKAAHSKRKKG